MPVIRPSTAYLARRMRELFGNQRKRTQRTRAKQASRRYAKKAQ